MNPRTYGMLLCTIGVVLLSPDVLVVRWIELEHSTLLFWRGIMLTAGFTAVGLVRYRTKLLRVLIGCRWAGMGCGLTFALTTYCFTQAMQLTSATAAMMLISTAPVFAAVLSWLILKEKPRRRTVITIVMTLGGIAIIVADQGGHNSLRGNLFALGSAIFMSLNFTLARMAAPQDLSPGLIIGGLFTCCLALLTDVSPDLPDTQLLGTMALTAAVLMPIGFTLLQIAPRYIQATEVSLFLLLEAILGPIWVWLVLSEVPGSLTLIGSCIVCAALGLHAGLRTPLEQKITINPTRPLHNE